MQLTETLEELLDLFNAKIHAIGPDYFKVHAHKALPQSVDKIAKEVNMSISTMPVHILGKTDVQDLVKGEVSYEYEFNDDAKEALRALLFLATEKERYEKFCEAFDVEVEEELDSKQE